MWKTDANQKLISGLSVLPILSIFVILATIQSNTTDININVTSKSIELMTLILVIIGWVVASNTQFNATKSQHRQEILTRAYLELNTKLIRNL